MELGQNLVGDILVSIFKFPVSIANSRKITKMLLSCP
jgi:hypothetical protein